MNKITKVIGDLLFIGVLAAAAIMLVSFWVSFCLSAIQAIWGF